MAVDQYALTTVDDLLLQLGLTRADLLATGLDVWCDASDATSATATIAIDGITLVITGGANAGTSTVDWATYTTVTAVVDQINATAGWSARVLLAGSADAANVEPLVQTGCLGYGARVEAQVVNIYWLETLIDGASARIEAHIGYNILSRSYKQWLDGSGRQWIRLPQHPLTAVGRMAIGSRTAMTIENTSTDAVSATAAVRVDSDGQTDALVLTVIGGANAGASTLTFASNATLTAMETAVEALGTGWAVELQDLADIPEGTIPSTDLRPQPAVECLDAETSLYIPNRNESGYIEEHSTGRLWRGVGGCFPISAAEQNTPLPVYVEYTAGRATVPADLAQAAARFAAVAYQQAQANPAMKSEKLGPWEYEVADVGRLDAALFKTIDGYRERSV